MATHGYVTHARRATRFTVLLLAGYVVAFELIGAFVLTLPLLFVDHEHTILSNPTGYALRYGLPVAVASTLLFLRLYRGHAAAVSRSLHVRFVGASEEPRFVSLAEEACITLGVRLPRFGVIEVEELNALTVGEGPNRGLIVATRGLLDKLDDDELLSVFAHEASHIRQGDTRLLAANHALMRTAVLLQVHNPFRLEDWRQMILPLLLPPLLVIMLAGSAATMAAMTLARSARRRLKLGRDHVADGEAVRVTHHPEALLSALAKIGGRSAFVGSPRVEGLLFDGPADREGGTHPAIAARRAAIAALGAGLIDPSRQRRDTRGATHVRFGRAAAATAAGASPLYPTDATGRPLEQPPTATLKMLAMRFGDPGGYRQWQEACIAWCEWRVTDRRNIMGLAPVMVLPVAATAMFLLVFWWPSGGNLAALNARFGPGVMVAMAAEVSSGPDCSGPSYPDGLCPEYHYSAAQLAAKRTRTAPEAVALASGASKEDGPSGLSAIIMPACLLLMLSLALFRPGLLRWLVGVNDANQSTYAGEPWAEPRPNRHELNDRHPKIEVDSASVAPVGFGRKRV